MELFRSLDTVNHRLFGNEKLDAETVLMTLHAQLASNCDELRDELPMDLEAAESSPSGWLILVFVPLVGHTAKGLLRMLDRICEVGRGDLRTTCFSATEVNGRIRIELPPCRAK